MDKSVNEKEGCLSVIFPFLRKFSDQTPQQFPYRLRDDFLSAAEFSMFKILADIGQNRFSVQVKVRLADIFYVSRPNENISYLNKIAQRHVDFLVCDSITMKPLLGIELDDSTHNQKRRIERDDFLDQVFQSAGLPLLRLPVHHEYHTSEIESKINLYLNGKTKTDEETPEAILAESNSSVPLCPKCNIPMILRTATQGVNKGKQFYGCHNYPRCHEVKPYNPDSNSGMES